MADWSFLDGVRPGSDAELAARFKMQCVSDMYKGLQARLDGYRQSAGAIFVGVIAAALTFDSAFVRLLLDKSTLDAIRLPAYRPISETVALGSGLIVVGVCFSGRRILEGIGEYFSEMTSTIYKIDDANKVWERGAWLENDTLYPMNFKLGGNDLAKDDVSRSPSDPTLIGWRDPAITRFRDITSVLMVLHLVFYGLIVWQIGR